MYIIEIYDWDHSYIVREGSGKVAVFENLKLATDYVEFYITPQASEDDEDEEIDESLLYKKENEFFWKNEAGSVIEILEVEIVNNGWWNSN